MGALGRIDGDGAERIHAEKLSRGITKKTTSDVEDRVVATA